MNSEKKVCR